MEDVKSKKEEFKKIIDDFTSDVVTSYPEFKQSFDTINYDEYYDYCKNLYPENFFNILYENNELFDDVNTKFLLPNIDFHRIMNDDTLSEQSKKTIWKYLQLILFCVCNDIKDKEDFGDANLLFEAISENDLHSKIQETMDEMKNIFLNMPEDISLGDIDEFASAFQNISGAFEDTFGDVSFEDTSGSSNMFENMMDADKMKDHLSGIMSGKIGSLAKEIAEEAAKELGLEEEELTPDQQQNFMKNLFKNPAKLLKIVKNIGNKLEEKFKSGELKESELLEEAQDIMGKMKDMPGLKNMMNSMGLNSGGKFDFKGMASKMQSTMRNAKQKERMQEKLRKRQEERAAAAAEEQQKDLGQATQISEDTFVWNDENSNASEPMLKSSSSSKSKKSSNNKKKKGKKKKKN